MAESSFDSSFSNAYNLQHHNTPVFSPYVSPRHLSSSLTSHGMSSSRPPTARRRGHYRPAPAAPFATDDDMSWQSEVSWQIEPTGWRDNGSLGAALSPWTDSTSTSSRVLRRSANDYYQSQTYGGYRSYANPHYDSSSYSAAHIGRLELQSYVFKDDLSFLQSKERRFSDQRRRSNQGISSLGTIKEGSSRHVNPFGDEDRLNSTDFDPVADIERQLHLSKTNSHHKHDDSDWFSVSCDDRGYRKMSFSMDAIGDGFQHGRHAHDFTLSASHQYHDSIDQHKDIELASVHSFEDDEEEEEVAKPVGLFSLFKYSTKLDMVLVILGCIGALINGGSLPWYSFLFGKFVNRINKDSKSTDKTQMMKDVEKVTALNHFEILQLYNRNLYVLLIVLAS